MTSLGTELPEIPAPLAARNVALRPRSDKDEAFIRDVYVAYRWDELAVTGWPDESRLAFLHDQHRLQELHYRNHYGGAVFAVIEVADRPVGRLYLLRRDGDLRIIDIALMPEFRKQGLGSGLLRAVQEQARRLGISKVSIHVEQNNPALKLYERLGFSKTELRGVYYLLEWQSDV